jgi:hypothetical protein
LTISVRENPLQLKPEKKSSLILALSFTCAIKRCSGVIFRKRRISLAFFSAISFEMGIVLGLFLSNGFFGSFGKSAQAHNSRLSGERRAQAPGGCPEGGDAAVVGFIGMEFPVSFFCFFKSEEFL